jgi:DNA-binding NarL/FixJ family response regulator
VPAAVYPPSTRTRRNRGEGVPIRGAPKLPANSDFSSGAGGFGPPVDYVPLKCDGLSPDYHRALGEAGLSTNGAPSEITCLIADDHEVVREGLRLSLSRAPQIRVVGEASDGASAVAIAERRRPNVVIMDVRMPGMDGLEATKILSERLPQTAVLIFTAYGERSLLGRGLEAGAKGYILKEAPHSTLLRAIEKVASGEGYVDPALMPALLTREREEMLTVREREILQLLADGMSNADVASRLFISQETVKSHVRHILAKLEADTRTHAVAIALRESIID